jgi:hypothetical protein
MDIAMESLFANPMKGTHTAKVIERLRYTPPESRNDPRDRALENTLKNLVL